MLEPPLFNAGSKKTYDVRTGRFRPFAAVLMVSNWTRKLWLKCCSCWCCICSGTLWNFCRSCDFYFWTLHSAGFFSEHVRVVFALLCVVCCSNTVPEDFVRIEEAWQWQIIFLHRWFRYEACTYVRTIYSHSGSEFHFRHFVACQNLCRIE